MMASATSSGSAAYAVRKAYGFPARVISSLFRGYASQKARRSLANSRMSDLRKGIAFSHSRSGRAAENLRIPLPFTIPQF